MFPADMDAEARVYLVLLLVLALALILNAFALRHVTKSADRAERNEGSARRGEDRARERADRAEERVEDLQAEVELWRYQARTVTVEDHHDTNTQILTGIPRHAAGGEPDATMVMGQPGPDGAI